MKRHHIVAIFSFIFGGLFAYVQFHHGDTDRAIRTGIICIIVGIVALFYEKLRAWLRPVGVAVPLVIIGLMAAHAVSTGNIGEAIFLFIGIIVMAVLHFLQDKPFVKEKIQPWLGP
ncbi:hypothetical protein J4G02_17030 [Candidatus Poribacteria bacterium]|nr:hypothetical protein [Candidatus Poribacteria bacterium]